MIFGPKFATLVFTDTAIKAVSARPTPRGFKISFIAKKSLPPQVVFNGQMVNQSVFREALKTFFLENYSRLKTKNVVLGLNEQETFFTSIRFEEKPKKLSEEIKTKIAPDLPFNLDEASVIYREISPRTYQVVATKLESLRILTNIIEDAGFSLKAIVPTPTIFPKLVGPKKPPYLFISSEEDLIYSLVVNDEVIFSSTFKLKKPLAQSEKDVIMLAREILEVEYTKNNQEPLKTVYVYGRETEFLKSFFIARKFITQIVYDSSESSQQTGYDFADYSRAIALSFYDASSFVFPKSKISKNLRAPSGSSTKRRFNLISLLLISLVILFAAAILIFWPNLKDIFLSSDKDKAATPSKATPASAARKPKEATPETEKKEATASSKPQVEINKADYKIRILNGSGTVGTASQARDYLIDKGYNVVDVGNAANFNYQSTNLQVKNSKKAILDLLTKDLRERYAINVGSPLSEGEQFDVLIIVGGE
ncbi:MAG TPA: LytR C-terminal domain-containing protein [Candidatus Nanoarchaeia archaeon]